ncbi:SMI1/KNR4 family protein [Clostridium cavendishii]|uniref:SMI1/KNR4 family protein n=1 Tax=Clostridium cavendishii TaxID=349931 RepID=UPI00093417B7|nr:SMI1/KNR4 family protein [Clostridium cavendishii]
MDEFCSGSDYYINKEAVTDEMIKNAEKLLGYKLPQAYIELIKTRNGGSTVNKCFSTNRPTLWAEDHIAITGICGIGGTWGIDSDELVQAIF